MAIDMSQFHQVFFEETSEHLASMETLLLDLDVANPSPEQLNAIFRAAHSIKGGSGTFGFTDMTEVTHVLETLLDRLRKQEIVLRPEMIDAFLAAGDVLRAQLAHHQGGPAADQASIDDVRARLQGLASDGEEAGVEPAAVAPALRQIMLECVLPPAIAGKPAVVTNLMAALEDVAAVNVEHRPDADNPRLAAMLTCTLTDDEIREALAFYLAPDEIHLAEPGAEEEAYGFFQDVEPTQAAVPVGEAAIPDADPGYGFFVDLPTADTELAIEVPASEVPIIEVPICEADPDGRFGLFEDAPGKPEHLPRRDVSPAESPAAIEGLGYGLFVDAPGGCGLFDEAPGAEVACAAAWSEPSSGRRLIDNPSVEVARTGRRETDKTATAANSDTSIRVSVDKVDQLVNLVGELVITQAMLAEAAGRLDPGLAERLLLGVDQLARNSRDLQEAVMSIRMLPIGMVFSRFPRVVRDLAGKLGKQVEFRTVGESTELDKSLIEKIADPLTHLVRNSLDHGIETPEARIATGKPPRGTLTLRASHQGGNIVVEVIDDGAGLDRARILAKARERELPAHDGMSDHEVWQLIFAPGFSTAEQVTDLSGRGVGMDVVRRNIEGLGGRVELESSPGHGTRTVIRLPLTLAILDGMSVDVAGETYIVPINAVVESLQVPADALRTLGGDSRVVRVRDEYLPLVALAEVMGVPEAAPGPGIVVVVETDEGKAALLVDALLGQHQVVIKSLESNYRKVPGMSGATILGDGRVALILDVPAIVRLGLASGRRREAA